MSARLAALWLSAAALTLLMLTTHGCTQLSHGPMAIVKVPAGNSLRIEMQARVEGTADITEHCVYLIDGGPGRGPGRKTLLIFDSQSAEWDAKKRAVAFTLGSRGKGLAEPLFIRDGDHVVLGGGQFGSGRIDGSKVKKTGVWLNPPHPSCRGAAFKVDSYTGSKRTRVTE